MGTPIEVSLLYRIEGETAQPENVAAEPAGQKVGGTGRQIRRIATV